MKRETITERFASWQSLYGLSYDRRIQRARILRALDERHPDPDAWVRADVLLTVDATVPPVDGDAPTMAAHRRLRAWQSERLSFVACVLGDEPIDEPTVDDYGAVLVAIDLVETGRDDEASKLLEAEAPRRLNRKCPACGAIAKYPCREPGETKVVVHTFASRYWVRGMREDGERLIPHLSRVEPLTPTPDGAG